MSFAAYLRVIESVDELPDAPNLTLVTIGELLGVDRDDGEHVIDTHHQVIANKDNGVPRWEQGETCVYVPVDTIVPEDVLQDRGYWDEEKNRGLLGGSKNNRVKERAFAKSEANPSGYVSRGLLFKVEKDGYDLYVTRRDKERLKANAGDDVAEFLGLKEHKA